MHLSRSRSAGTRRPLVIRDMYDLLPPERGAELRRLNKERLAELERHDDERRARVARLVRDSDDTSRRRRRAA